MVGAHCLLGQEGTAPWALLSKGKSELECYPTVQTSFSAVTEISPRGDSFLVECEGGALVSARKILLATGLADEIPEIDGIFRFYGRSVHHVLTATALSTATKRSLYMVPAIRARVWR
jgi:thioredoxin reductase